MAGRIEIYKNGTGEFQFRLRSKLGDVVAISPEFATRAQAKQGVEDMLKVVAKAKIVDESSS